MYVKPKKKFEKVREKSYVSVYKVPNIGPPTVQVIDRVDGGLAGESERPSRVCWALKLRSGVWSVFSKYVVSMWAAIKSVKVNLLFLAR